VIANGKSANVINNFLSSNRYRFLYLDVDKQISFNQVPSKLQLPYRHQQPHGQQAKEHHGIGEKKEFTAISERSEQN